MNAGKSDKSEKADKAEKSEKKSEIKNAAPVMTPHSRGKIYDNILHTIGGTPLVRLPRITAKHKLEADIVAKLEFFNPLSSTKDRIGIALIEDAERQGKATAGKTTLIDATAGNTAHALAFAAAAKGYKLILVMPETVPFERRKMLTLLGAELYLTPGNHGMKGAIEKAKDIVAKSKDDIFMFNQFENPISVKVHAETTAEEIWTDTGGKIDILIAGVGSGGTITGISHNLRKRKNTFKAYAVEPEESPVLSGGKPVQHGIAGIGAGFVPPILDTKVVDGVLKVDTKRAVEMGRELARTEGIPGGISSGAALAAAIDVAKLPENKGKMIVVIFPSFAERYLSTDLFKI